MWVILNDLLVFDLISCYKVKAAKFKYMKVDWNKAFVDTFKLL